jgi:glycosyltransferase involved in cell wall biosynthesis
VLHQPKLRVLHVYRIYFPDPPGGLQQAIRQIGLATREFGVESRIFTLSPRPGSAVLHYPEGEVTRRRSWWAPASCDLGGPAAFAEFRRLSRWADVVHLHFPWPFADLLRLVAAPGKPMVMTYHSDIVRQKALGALYGPLMRRTLSRVSAVVATSPAYAASSPVLSRHVPSERLRVIPLGITDNVKDRTGLPARGGVVERLGLRGRPFVLSLGVLRYYKGLHYLVEAAAEIDGDVVIAGSGPEGKRLQSMVDDMPLSNVHFAGQVSEDEKNELLWGCHVLVLPSHLRSEAFGMVLVEAAMRSKPLISCDIGTGTTYVNQHGETGIVVPPESSDALARACNHLLHDASAAERMAKAARARYETLFSSEALGCAYAALYRDVLAT